MDPRNGPEEWLDLDQLSDELLYLLGRGEEQAVVLPEWAAVGPLDRVEPPRLSAETRGERGGCRLAQLRCLAVDDHDNIQVILRERRLKRRLPHSPGELVRQQSVGVGAHGEVACDVAAHPYAKND